MVGRNGNNMQTIPLTARLPKNLSNRVQTDPNQIIGRDRNMTSFEAKPDKPPLEMDAIVNEADAVVAKLDAAVKTAEDAAKRLRVAEDGPLEVLAAPFDVVADDDWAAGQTSPG